MIISVHRGYLLDQFDTGSQVHSKVDKLPDDTLFLILLLLEDEHVMIEELLQFLVREVDTQLLETVILNETRIRNIFAMKLGRNFFPLID